MRKTIGFYVIYLFFVWIYFAFLYPLDTYGETRYAAYSHAMFFSKLPLPWIVLYLLIKKRYSHILVTFTEKFSKRDWLKTVYFCGLLAGLYHLAELPFNVVWFEITHWAGTSHQPFWDWIYEKIISFLLYWIGLSAVVYTARLLMGKFKKMWWLFVWLLALPVAVFFVYIEPVWIDPLYEDFTVMEPGPLREAIETMAAQAGLENADLLQVNMSEKTTTFNAYVTGLWGNGRIVLWDTTLEGMEQEQILFILAHEIGHYVYGHVPLGVTGYLVMGLFLLWLTSLLYQRIWSRLSRQPDWGQPNELKAVPVLLLTASVLLTAVQPAALAVSRQIEIAADNYAIEHTENPVEGAEAFVQMAEQSQTDVSPLFWVKWMRYSHPAIEERIARINEKAE